jgi:hypothetical protein
MWVIVVNDVGSGFSTWVMGRGSSTCDVGRGLSLSSSNLVMDGQCVAELATVGVTHLGTAPPLVVGTGHCAYAAFGVFTVHVVLVDVGDVALAFCWLRGGWSAGAGMGMAGYSHGCAR